MPAIDIHDRLVCNQLPLLVMVNYGHSTSVDMGDLCNICVSLLVVSCLRSSLSVDVSHCQYTLIRAFIHDQSQISKILEPGSKL